MTPGQTWRCRRRIGLIVSGRQTPLVSASVSASTSRGIDPTDTRAVTVRQFRAPALPAAVIVAG